jgi:hypothetical protein
VNVPVDVQPTIDALPRTLDQSGTISVKLKKNLIFKSCDFRENIRPSAGLQFSQVPSNACCCGLLERAGIYN